MQNPVCAIVGAGPGIGLAVAKKFAAEGFGVALLSRQQAKLEELAAEVGVGARGYQADAGDEASLRAALAKCTEELGNPSVLVYNASVMNPGLPSVVATEHLLEDFKVNVAGAAVAAQAVIPAMRKAGGGTILITGGGLALEPYPHYSSLAIGKAGVRNYAFSLAAELEASNIHVATVTVCGFVKEGTHFAPDLIAGVYWKLHQQPREEWEREVIYR